ncbi:MAG: RagB/SusD family nutrient uptake outer membrane protein, partial [Candidatus Dadabacteria bacterium]
QTDFKQGYAVTKYKNLKRDGSSGQSKDYSDIDIPLFRLPEMFLIYAEAANKTNGDLAAAAGYINQLRQRAYGNTSGNIIATALSGQAGLDFILDERARELYWEGFRRTDLIRHHKFTESTYLWPWKGGIAGGTGVASYRSLYPIPSRDVNANTNLVQNPGY